jgi:ABC-type branched-subunit amino acid transport system substrate-binding protein
VKSPVTFLADKYKGKNVAIIQDQTTYGKGLADATKATMNKAGLQEKLYEGITVGEKRFLGRRLQDEAGQDRRDLLRRPAQRGRA